MIEYIKFINFFESVSIVFYVDNEKVMAVCEKLVEIDENACMNSRNWAALIDCYIRVNAYELVDTFEVGIGEGIYNAEFENSEEGEENELALAGIITSLIEHEDDLFEFVRYFGDVIDWD